MIEINFHVFAIRSGSCSRIHINLHNGDMGWMGVPVALVDLPANRTILKLPGLHCTPHIRPKDQWRERNTFVIKSHETVHGAAYADSIDGAVKLIFGFLDDLKNAINNHFLDPGRRNLVEENRWDRILVRKKRPYQNRRQ